VNRPATAESPAIQSESAEELYEHAPCGFLSSQADGTLVRVNQTLVDWTGYSRELLLGGNLRDLLPTSAQLFYETHYLPLLQLQGFVREMALDLRCRNGAVLPVLISSSQQRDADGRRGTIRTVIYDATERRMYERELLAARRRAEQLAAVVEASADAIIVISPNLVVQSWNHGAEQLFGYPPAEAIGRTIRDLIVPAERWEEARRAFELLRSGQRVQLETERVHRDGSRIEVSLGLTPHIEPPGELVAISAIIRDITAWRRLEAQLRRAEQLQAVAALAGGVAHQINNQMAVVLGFGDFVLRALGPGHPQAYDVKAMVAAAAKSAETSRQLLAFSRQLPIERQEVRLSQLVDSLIPRLRALLTTEHQLEVRHSGTAAPVSVDPIQIEQILVQLIRNARDAMDGGGRLTVSTEQVRLTEADAAEHAEEDVVPGEYVLLSVADTGRGMDQTTLSRLFEPFFTTKEVGQGMGLGLPMVYGVVKQHGGQLWAESDPGQGTTVRVHLPAASTITARP
jgi:PAS domain S-box-containing protein